MKTSIGTAANKIRKSRFRKGNPTPQKKKRALRTCLVVFATPFVFFLLILILHTPALLVATKRCSPESGSIVPNTSLFELDKEPNYLRSGDIGYLTIPEWYVVFNAEEYAAHIKSARPSQFQYLRAIQQFWQSYYQACDAIKTTANSYPYNKDYHILVAIVAISFDSETILRGLYEKTVGRIFEWRTQATEEERYAEQVAFEYGKFLHTIPWFRFPYGQKLQSLWHQTQLWGPYPLRKWERKLALSFEYAIKAAYAALIRSLRDAYYSPEYQETQFVVRGITDDKIRSELLAQNQKLKFYQYLQIPAQQKAGLSEQLSLLSLPRYEEFTLLLPNLAEQGLQFLEIAGNQQVLLSVLAQLPETDKADKIDGARQPQLVVGELLFSMHTLVKPQQRLYLRVPVSSLHLLLQQINQQPDLQLEHIYDY